MTNDRINYPVGGVGVALMLESMSVPRLALDQEADGQVVYILFLLPRWTGW